MLDLDEEEGNPSMLHSSQEKTGELLQLVDCSYPFKTQASDLTRSTSQDDRSRRSRAVAVVKRSQGRSYWKSAVWEDLERLFRVPLESFQSLPYRNLPVNQSPFPFYHSVSR
ncbi:hypothetical protein OIU78_026255 [Salix suchowensis]|nr:hypothetical protein OIU78_026255 [Salix suchowensis]